MDDENVSNHFRLTADEDFLITAWQYRMMQRDIAASTTKQTTTKRADRDQFRTNALTALATRDAQAYTNPDIAGAAFLTAEAAADGETSTALQALEEAGPNLSAGVGLRSRSLLLFIDLYGFEPWTTARWDQTTRQTTLAEACESLPRLRPEDVTSVGNAYTEVTKRLIAKSRSWRKLAFMGVAGLGVGALTAGFAAPAIATLYGTTVLGYSGAVATSAGMAALGGGSLAAGGYGMAGGAAFITATGATAAGSAATLGAHATGFTAAQIAADVIRLQVAARLVLLDAEGNDEAAKAIVTAMRERVATLGHQIAHLARKAETLRTERDQALADLAAEHDARVSAEGKLARLQAEVRDRVRHPTGRPQDAGLQHLEDQISEVAQTSKATEFVLEFVRAGADDLAALAV